MSQTETAVQSETKSNNSNNVQVVPQQRKKGKLVKCLKGND